MLFSRNDTGAADHGKAEPRDDDSRFSQIGCKRPPWNSIASGSRTARGPENYHKTVGHPLRNAFSTSRRPQ